MRTNDHRLRHRLLWSAMLATGGVVASTVLVPSWGGAGAGESKALIGAYNEATDPASTSSSSSTMLSPDGHNHVHDPATKNDISRSPDAGSATDPTTPAERLQALDAVEEQRAEPDPSLRPIPQQPQRTAVPGTRYAMAGGCYAIQGSSGWVQRDGDSYSTTGTSRDAAEPFHFQATTLGEYLLFDSQEQFLSSSGAAIAAADEPGESGVWTVRRPGETFTFTQGDQGLRSGDPMTKGQPATGFRLRLTDGCAEFPEITTNITGRTFRGVSGFQEVRGTTDAHTHGMAFRFLGGGLHCGEPWSPYGVTAALVDCEDHTTTGGQGALLENFLSGENGHDPVGWPTFKDWPAPNSLTHEGTYYKWMERAWQGGLRIFVNLLVENNQLCAIYPIKGEEFAETQCDDMKSVALQARDMRELERYVDAQYGGPGRGWYRIVTNPFEARRVINAGKLAVVMGIETSVPFGCSTIATPAGDQAECTAAEIDAQLDDVYKMGVRQMELVNKFDNALSGIAGDSGAIGPIVNGANFSETQSFWDMERCDSSYPEGVEDKAQPTAPGAGEINPEQQDALFGAIGQLFGNFQPAPVYGPAPHCNQRDLTDLGEHTIRGMVERQMIFDPDHMSVEARKDSLDLIDQLNYSGILSSHSWATPDAYERIYELGGVVFPYAGDSTGFVEKWEKHLTWADPRYYFGIGYGADINGLGAQGDPRGAGAQNPVTYPFTGLGGVTVRKQQSGERTYDINVDGVSHYGLYPDWLQDLENVAGTEDITTDMSRGAEAYLQMWERAVGVRNDACRQPSVAYGVSRFRNLPRGSSVRDVLLRVGQPHTRLDQSFGYCAQRSDGTSTRVRAVFSDGGRLLRVE